MAGSGGIIAYVRMCAMAECAHTCMSVRSTVPPTGIDLRAPDLDALQTWIRALLPVRRSPVPPPIKFTVWPFAQPWGAECLGFWVLRYEQDSREITAWLLDACSEGDERTVAAAVRAGADVNAHTASGISALVTKEPQPKKTQSLHTCDPVRPSTTAELPESKVEIPPMTKSKTAVRKPCSATDVK